MIAQHIYGIDIPTREELIAAEASIENIKNLIGVDELIYGSVEDMKEACLEGNPEIKDLEMSCFDARYITGDVTEEILHQQSLSRACERKD